MQMVTLYALWMTKEKRNIVMAIEGLSKWLEYIGYFIHMTENVTGVFSLPLKEMTCLNK